MTAGLIQIAFAHSPANKRRQPDAHAHYEGYEKVQHRKHHTHGGNAFRVDHSGKNHINGTETGLEEHDNKQRHGQPNDVFSHAATQQIRMIIFLHTIKPDKGGRNTFTFSEETDIQSS